jgi:outer membrane protein OmpA-like peptidoglycan-associated protein
MLVTALSLVLGSGLAGAAAAQPQDPDQAPPPADSSSNYGTAPTTEAAPKTTPPADTSATTTTPDAAERAKKIESVDLLFDTASSQLSSNAYDELKTLARWAKCNPNGAVILEGHADPTGTAAFNMTLSGERAAAVRAKLIAMGVPSEHIVVTLYGEHGPRRATFAQDRRVTVRAVPSPVPADDITAQK